MPQDLALVRPKASPAKAPNLPESVRRLLADPYSLGDDVPPWNPPAVPPDSSSLRAAAVQLQQGLLPASPGHMQWCLNKLFVLPTREGTAVKAAFQADNFIDACGHFPDDLWTAGTLELLQTMTFRPSPAELFKTVSAKHAERQRMIERVKVMLGGKAAERPAVFVPDSREVILRTTLKWARKRGDAAKAARYERELAQLENREPEAWASETTAETGIPVSTNERPDAPVPLSASMQARTLRSTAQFHRAAGRERYADQLDRQADALMPMQRTDIPEVEHGEAA